MILEDSYTSGKLWFGMGISREGIMLADIKLSHSFYSTELLASERSE